MNGTLIFGIGTQTNNSLGSAHVLTLDPNTGNISTGFKESPTPAFSIPVRMRTSFLIARRQGCRTARALSGFYCPSSRLSFSATNTGTNNASSMVSFNIDNADTLFSNSADTVFPTLGGPNSGMFDWGLPFFYGRHVFVAIQGAQTPGGAGPYWAY